AANFNDRLAAGVGQHHSHLQEDAEEIADVVGTVLDEAFRTVAALEQKTAPRRDRGKLPFQVARFTGKNERREGRELGFDAVQRRPDTPAPAEWVSRASFRATIYRLVERTPSSTPESSINRAFRHDFQACSVLG